MIVLTYIFLISTLYDLLLNCSVRTSQEHCCIIWHLTSLPRLLHAWGVSNSRQLIQGEWILRRQDTTLRTHLAADEDIKLFYIFLVVKNISGPTTISLRAWLTSFLVKRSLYSAKTCAHLLADSMFDCGKWYIQLLGALMPPSRQERERRRKREVASDPRHQSWWMHLLANMLSC